jgi:hypothetical protein
MAAVPRLVSRSVNGVINQVFVESPSLCGKPVGLGAPYLIDWSDPNTPN